MKKYFLAILIVFLVIGVVFFVRINQNSYSDLVGKKLEVRDKQTIVNNTDSLEENSNSENSGKISLLELGKHDQKADCWVSYQGKVYDITSFLPKHKGSSAAIEPYCGTAEEFEKAFTKKHGTSKVSTLMKMGVLMGDFDVMGEING